MKGDVTITDLPNIHWTAGSEGIPLQVATLHKRRPVTKIWLLVFCTVSDDIESHIIRHLVKSSDAYIQRYVK